MTREEAISHIEYSIKAYQNLIENDARSGEAIGKDIKGEWKSEKTLADAYMKMIESLKMAIMALEKESSEDCISRQIISEYVESHIQEINTGYGDLNSHTNRILRMIVDYIEKMPKAEQEPKTDDFARWVAREIFDEDWGYNKDSFAEIACRKLAKLGIVIRMGDEWELVEPQESEG